MIEKKKAIIEKTMGIEEGYSNNLYDSGGETKYGITEAVARQNEYTGKMEDLPYSFAYNLYNTQYWQKMHLDAALVFSPKVVEEVFDTGVNQGVLTSVRFLQRALNVLNRREELYPDIVVDGVAGTQTIAALESYLDNRGARGEDILLTMLNCLQGARYIEIAELRKKDEEFIFGWFDKRVVIKNG